MATYNQSKSYGINTTMKKYKLSTLFQRARRDRGFTAEDTEGRAWGRVLKDGHGF